MFGSSREGGGVSRLAAPARPPSRPGTVRIVGSDLGSESTRSFMSHVEKTNTPLEEGGACS